MHVQRDGTLSSKRCGPCPGHRMRASYVRRWCRGPFGTNGFLLNASGDSLPRDAARCRFTNGDCHLRTVGVPRRFGARPDHDEFQRSSEGRSRRIGAYQAASTFARGPVAFSDPPDFGSASRNRGRNGGPGFGAAIAARNRLQRSVVTVGGRRLRGGRHSHGEVGAECRFTDRCGCHGLHGWVLRWVRRDTACG